MTRSTLEVYVTLMLRINTCLGEINNQVCVSCADGIVSAEKENS
jgi:hypothetical protein